MFDTPEAQHADGLNKLIDQITESMLTMTPGSKEYTEAVDQLSQINELKEKPSKNRVDPDTLAVVFGNLLGILIIVKFERMNVMTSKATSLLLRPKN